MDISLSLSITIIFVLLPPALFIASYAIPALIAPSPITATTSSDLFDNLFATAIPSPEDIEVELCAAPKGSYSLSLLLVKPESPLPFLRVRILSFLPVKILCG